MVIVWHLKKRRWRKEDNGHLYGDYITGVLFGLRDQKKGKMLKKDYHAKSN